MLLDGCTPFPDRKPMTVVAGCCFGVMVQADLKAVSLEDLRDGSASGCLQSETCSLRNKDVTLEEGLAQSLICDKGEEKTYSELACCDSSDLEKVCPVISILVSVRSLAVEGMRNGLSIVRW